MSASHESLVQVWSFQGTNNEEPQTAKIFWWLMSICTLVKHQRQVSKTSVICEMSHSSVMSSDGLGSVVHDSLV